MEQLNNPYASLSDMALFVEVARCGSFRHAANRLDMPVATLSRRIAAMERRLSRQLLVRTTRSVSLAHSAQAYFERCLAVIEAADAAQNVLLAHDGQAERIRISMPVDLGVSLLGSIIAAYAAETSGLRVEMDLSTQTRDLFREPVDLVFRIGSPMDDRVVARKLWDVAAGLYSTPACLKRHGPLSDPQALTQVPCLQLTTTSGPMPWRVGGAHWVQAPGPVTLSANNVGLLVTLTAGGHGFALLPRYLAIDFLRRGKLVESLPEAVIPAWPLYAITASRSLSPRVRNLITHVRARLSEVTQ